MRTRRRVRKFSPSTRTCIGALGAFGLLWSMHTAAADEINGRVLGAGAPVVGSTVTLWAAGTGAPQQLAQVQSDSDGRFTISADGHGADLYLLAKGGRPSANQASRDNPTLTMISVLGYQPPPRVVVNEMTTVASVWTHAQFLNGAGIQGHALGLKIAAGNVPNFVDLQTGGWGITVQDALNSGQTPTMANFATLADLLSGCATEVKANACSKLFAAATPPTGVVPTDTLTAAQSISRYSWYKPDRLFALLDEFYPVPQGKNLRPVPFMPYLNFSPSAWVLPLKFDGGGYRAGGKAMFDSEGNLWVGDNFTVGWQGQDAFWQGNATKFNPNGKPLSPITTGFAGGGMQGGTFGAAVDAKDNAWFSSYGSKSIAVFDKNGTPLTPPEGITFDGQLGLMQGIIATPSGDVWASASRSASSCISPRVIGPGAGSSAKATAPNRASRSSGHFTSPLISRIGSGFRTPAIKSRASLPRIRAKPKISRRESSTAVSTSTARATYGSPTASAMGYWEWPTSSTWRCA